MIKIYQKCDLCGEERLLDIEENDKFSPNGEVDSVLYRQAVCDWWYRNQDKDICSTCNAEYEIWLRERQQEKDDVK